uniref:hypothetical protein n=1 Tax=Serratia proteamaculans TaxID=28151 RepID=UPI001F4C32B2|nr:hypothetical protein [Serratia proteamaculans]
MLSDIIKSDEFEFSLTTAALSQLSDREAAILGVVFNDHDGLCHQSANKCMAWHGILL